MSPGTQRMFKNAMSVTDNMKRRTIKIEYCHFENQ